MIIDFHTHTFPDTIAQTVIHKLSGVSHTPPFTDGTASGLRKSMKESGVDLSVIMPVATSPKQVVTINNSSVAMNEKTEETGLLSFGCIHPDYEDWKQELARIARLGLKGIKIHPVYQKTDLDDLRYLRILDKAGELGLVVLVHAGIDIGYPEENQASPDKILNAVRQTGPVKLIVAHMGGWKRWAEAEELLVNTHVFLDTAFSTGFVVSKDDGFYEPEDLVLLDESRFLRMVRSFGADRILFGTDSPWSSQRESVAWIQNLPLTTEEKESIFAGNAIRLLGI